MNSEPNNEAGDLEAQLADYALGVLDPAVASELERSLAECRDRVLLAQQYAQVVGMLGYAAGPAEPPEGHKSRFMARLGSTPRTAEAAAPSPAAALSGLSPYPAGDRPGSRRAGTAQTEASTPPRVTDLAAERARRRPLPMALAATVAAALLLLVGAWGWSVKSEADVANSRLGAMQAALQSAPPGSLVFYVQSKAPAPADSWAFALLDPKTNQAVLVANRLQPLSPAQVYEMWWLPVDQGKAPVAAGVFNADSSGTARHQATAPETAARYSGLAVTIEPAPGGPKNTGPIVMLGTYSLP